MFSPPLLSGTGGTWTGWGRGGPSGCTLSGSSNRAGGSDGREPSPLPGCGLPATEPRSSGHILGNAFFFLLPNSNLQGSSSFHFHPCVQYPRSMSHAGESRYFPGTVPRPRKHGFSIPLHPGTRIIYIFSTQKNIRNPYSFCPLSS